MQNFFGFQILIMPKAKMIKWKNPKNGFIT